MGFWGKIAKITGISLMSAGGVITVGSAVMLGLGTNGTYEFKMPNFANNIEVLVTASNNSTSGNTQPNQPDGTTNPGNGSTDGGSGSQTTPVTSLTVSISGSTSVNQNEKLQISSQITSDSPSFDSSKVRYQWKISRDNGTNWTNLTNEGTDEKILTIVSVDDTYNNAQIKLEVTYEQNTFSSNAVKITVNSPTQSIQKIVVGCGSLNYTKIWINGKEIPFPANSKKISYNEAIDYAKEYCSAMDKQLANKQITQDALNKNPTYQYLKKIIQSFDLMVAGSVLISISSLTLIAGIVLFVINWKFK